MRINIPTPCPSCYGRMYSVRYDTILPILKERSWIVCKECDYEIESEEFKNQLLTI